MPKLTYLIGDATEPIKTPAIIMHCCNDIGAWGAGFVLALSKKWKEPEREYYNWFRRRDLNLGEVDFVSVEEDISVANIIGQHGIGYESGRSPIRYDALRTGIHEVFKYALREKMTVHAPKLGAGLAGGDWRVIEYIIMEEMTVDTFIYSLK
jgi:O-acetyl-ADP-ribose deacetylase (regulator of RNase III)